MQPVWQLLTKLVNTPLFAHPATAMMVYNSFCTRNGMSQMMLEPSSDLGAIRDHIENLPTRAYRGGMRTRANVEIETSRFSGNRVAAEDGGWRDIEPFLRTANGTGIISITGSLVNRGAYVGAQSGVTSYEGISHQLDRAAADRKTGAIFLDISTPGGEAMGNAEIAAKIREIDKDKPVFAMVNSLAASAGYMIASGAREIIGTPSSLSGSIGVIMLHLDMVEAAEKQGVKPTLITAGDHKADGHPLASLTPEALAEIKKGINTYYDIFTGDVAKGRGSRLTKKMARDTQARTYIGRDAVTAGLIDDIGSWEQVLQAVDKVSAKRIATPAQKKAKGPAQMSLLTVQQDAGNVPGQGEQQPSPQPGATTAPATPTSPAGMDAVTAAIISHSTIAAKPALLGPALALRAKAPSMSADDVVSFVSAHAAPAPAPTPATAPASAATPAAAHGNHAPTNDLAQRANDTGAQQVANGSQQPTAPGQQTGQEVTAASHPWGKHVEAANGRTAGFKKWEVGR